MSTVATRTDTALHGRRKSRFGCRNCKLRKVKCDETRPYCTNCNKYGVLCNFSLTVPDLQPISEKNRGQSRQPELNIKRKRTTASIKYSQHSLALQRYWQQSPPNTLSNGIWSSDGQTQYILDTQDWILFTKFRNRTVHSLGGKSMVDIYENCMLEKCFTHPFLMHGTLAVAAVHDRYLSDQQDPDLMKWMEGPTVRETLHVSRCTSLFNDWLSLPMTEDRKDPIWSGAGSLSILTFASTTARRKEDAWPLGPLDPSSDLEWLRLGAGKMTLWHMVNPMREGSVFRPMFQVLGDLRGQTMPATRRGTEGLLPELAELCDINEYSTAETNSYFTVAHALSRLLPLTNNEASLGKILMVVGKMHDAFEVLLHQRDPVALLLLCLWYAKARECKWWINFRTRYEIPAICQYLSKWHRDKVAIHSLLRTFSVI